MIMRPASWVIRDKETKAAIMETYNADFLKALNTARYEAVPILEYLQEINRKAKQ